MNAGRGRHRTPRSSQSFFMQSRQSRVSRTWFQQKFFICGCRQELPLQPLVHRNSAWTVLAASTVMALLKRRREGRPLQAAGGEVSAVSVDEEVMSHGTMNDDEPNPVLRYGVTNGSMLPWTSAKLPDLLPEVLFSGKALPPEAAGCGPDQLACLLSMLEAEEVDFVMAPAKDVALELPQGLVAAAVLREDARDAFEGREKAHGPCTKHA
ncbi:hemC [Symbiodinium sp. CCMP2592]|nr:hemC [Symbiodinium sp. CCMP2592]